MSVSVVIPTYNGEKYLALTLESVQAQTSTDWELIVIDDGSKDSTATLAEAFAETDPRIRVIRQENSGIARARNRGIAEADPKRPYLALLDHDDLWETDTLETQIRSMENLPRTIGAHGQVRLIDSQGETLHDEGIEHWYSERRGYRDGKARDWEPHEPTTLEVMALRPQIMTVGQVVMRKAVLRDMEMFDPDMVPADDYDFWLRLLLRGDLAYNPKPVVAWRKHDSNTSGNTQQMMAKDETVRDKVFNLPNITLEQQQILREGRQEHHRELALMRVEWAKLALQKRDLVSAGKHLRHAYKDYRKANA